MPAPALLKRDWEKDNVYLVQFPRAGCIPSPSPFALKLETWLRMKDIKYSNISNDFKKSSAKGQVPFIELDGRQVADSNFSIEHLKQHFNKEDDLSKKDQSHAVALHALIEEGLRWVVFYFRSRDGKWVQDDECFGKHARTFPQKIMLKTLAPIKIQRDLKATCHRQGIGRHSPDEVVDVAKKQLSALETIIGSKSYLLGEEPTTIDATAFGHLAQLYYGPHHNRQISDYMDNHTPHLVEYLKRIKTNFWPDWEYILETQALNTDWKNPPPLPSAAPKEEPAAAAEE